MKTLYKKNKNKIQQWTIEVDKNKFRTISGDVGGKLVTSKYTVCTGKNIGKLNEVKPEQQAIKEAEAKIKSKLEKGYVENSNGEGFTRFEPMLAHLYDDNKDKIQFPCYIQPKLDGIRCNINKDGMWSRKGKEIVSCPHIFNSLQVLFTQYPDLVLDGELYNHDLKEDFNELTSIIKKQKPTSEDLKKSCRIMEYHIYDMFAVKHRNIKFEDRQKFTLKVDSIHVEHVKTFECKDEVDIDNFYQIFQEEGYEGAIIRNNVPYVQDRTVHLLKRKEWLDDEFEIVDITEGFGNRSGMMGRIVMKTKAGEQFESDCSGLGGHKFYAEMLKNKDKYIGKFATVKFQCLTPKPRCVPRFGKVIKIDRAAYE